MSKYDALWEHVAKCSGDAVKLTYAEIEAIAGVPIDHSLLKYKKELTVCGWEVGKISMKAETVEFKRI